MKVAETRQYTSEGAVEIDMVIQVGLLKAGEFQAVLDDLAAVVQAAHAAGARFKAILEMVLLTPSEKLIACLLSQAAGADFVKTSTGFVQGGAATVEDVQLMRHIVGSEMGVKASAGIHSLAGAMALLNAGANRLGTTAGVRILQEAQQGSNPDR